MNISFLTQINDFPSPLHLHHDPFLCRGLIKCFVKRSTWSWQVANGRDYESGDKRGPRRGSRAGVLVSPHSKIHSSS